MITTKYCGCTQNAGQTVAIANLFRRLHLRLRTFDPSRVAVCSITDGTNCYEPQNIVVLRKKLFVYFGDALRLHGRIGAEADEVDARRVAAEAEVEAAARYGLYAKLLAVAVAHYHGSVRYCLRKQHDYAVGGRVRADARDSCAASGYARGGRSAVVGNRRRATTRPTYAGAGLMRATA